jgi:myo-inositol-1(or 4)-monophosphatase
MRVRVSGSKHLADAVISTGMKLTGSDDDARTLYHLNTISPACAGIRRFGAASIDLAWVAAGRVDAYWEARLHPWDVGAGMLLVREAGGFVSDYAGKNNCFENGEMVAGNEAIHGALLKALKKAV